MSFASDVVEVIRFEAFGRVFELHVRENDRLLRRRPTSGFELLTGRVAGDPDSWVRLMRRGDELRGIIHTAGASYAIEPNHIVAAASVTGAGPDDTVNSVFRLADVLIPAGAATCAMSGSSTLMMSGEAALEALAEELNSPQFMEAAGAAEQIEVGALGDFEFFGQFGSSSEAELMARFNIVDGIFSEQVGIAISVENPTIFESDAEDPFTDTTNAGDLLDEVMDYRVANHLSLGLTHLLTGRNLDGSTAGIAVRGETTPTGQPLFGACTASGVGLSQTQSFLASTSALIIAHEIGHNFGALHDGEPADPGDDPNPCESTPPTFLMAATLNGSSTFSQCSLDTMEVIIDAATCLSPAPVDDVALMAPADVAVAAGSQVNLQFSVSNVGDNDATGVAVQLSVPAGLTLLNLTASQGSCNLLVAECVLGTVAQGQTASVTATVSADAAGDAVVDGLVLADADDNAANDTDSVTVSVDSSVDLTASLTGDTNLGEGQPGQAQLTVANVSGLSAENTVVDLGSSSGLAVTAVSSPQGSCSLTQCTLGTLDAMSSVQITIDYLADTAGNESVTATASADPVDPATGNNTDQLLITVSAPPPASPASEGGGGGSTFGWPALIALAALAVARSRRRRPLTSR